jgi:hypothetical protein
MRVRQDPAAEWESTTGTATFSYIAGGACLQMHYESESMGMPLVGVAQTSFNRATGEWTETWIDNLGGAMSVYSGRTEDGKRVLYGKDYMGDEVWLTRTTTSGMRPDSYQFQLEHSRDDGKTWVVHMTVEYTKRSE